MKKSLFIAGAMMLASLTVGAVEHLYVTGLNNSWDATNPTELTLENGYYTMTVDKGNGGFKLSTAKGDWNTFNEGAKAANVTESGVTVDLYSSDQNIVMPWAGDWTIVINEDFTTLTATTETPKPTGYTDVYIRGDMNNWEAVDAWKFSTEDGVTYCLKDVTVSAADNFKLAGATWGAINYGGVTNMETDKAYDLNYNAGNCTVAADFTGNVIFNIETKQVYFSTKDDVTIPAVIEYPALYVRGLNDVWDANETTAMTLEDGIYTFTAASIAANDSFKIADAEWGADQWSTKNMAMEADTDYICEQVDGESTDMAMGVSLTDATITFDYSTKTLTITGTPDDTPIDASAIYLRGDMNEWGTPAEWQFTTTDNDNYCLANVTIAAGQEFKVADANFGAVNLGGVAGMEADKAYVIGTSMDNCTLATDFTGNVLFRSSTNEIYFSTKGDVTIPEAHKELYVVGTMTSWEKNDAYKMEYNGNGVYTYTFAEALPADAELKIYDGTWDWSFGMGEQNITLNQDIECWYKSTANFSFAGLDLNTDEVVKDLKVTFTLVEGSEVEWSSTPSIIKFEYEITSGVGSIAADNDAEARYFNLQGVEVAGLTKGNLYIRVSGDKAEKVIF